MTRRKLPQSLLKQVIRPVWETKKTAKANLILLFKKRKKERKERYGGLHMFITQRVMYEYEGYMLCGLNL